MTRIVDRITEIIDDERLNDRRFEKIIGKSSSYLNSLRKKNTSPSVDVMLTILENFPKYNLHWLMTGEGKKLAQDSESIVSRTRF